MRKSPVVLAEDSSHGASIFSLLKPYTGMVILLVLLALVGNGINLLIPIIISRGIDAYGNGNLLLSKVITNFLVAAAFILVFTLSSGYCPNLYF